MRETDVPGASVCLCGCGLIDAPPVSTRDWDSCRRCSASSSWPAAGCWSSQWLRETERDQSIQEPLMVSQIYKSLCVKTHPPLPNFTITWDLFPGVGRVHEGSIVDLVIDVFVLIKRKCPAQADVHDDADRPHVQWAVVALVEQNFRCQVSGGPNHRATERLFADDTGKSKVTKLHLEKIEGRVWTYKNRCYFYTSSICGP